MNKQIDFEKKMAEITADVSNRAKAFKYVQFNWGDPTPNSPKMAKIKVDQDKALDVYNSYSGLEEWCTVDEEFLRVSNKDAKTLAKSAWASYAFLMNVASCNDVCFENKTILNDIGDEQLLFDAIAKSPEYSFRWAMNGIGGRFDEGEEAIATNAEYSFRYAKFCTKKPFKAGEYAIATDEIYSELYANSVLKADFYIDGILICKKGRGLKRG